ncbi:hypothetical protein KIW84_041263 [Lathyrus oleraceus]|uniref:Uncharacterized protein n=1 Tax=Pisum sativum TaxID=3888 RepID=A0A9D5AQX9_PEA|nr:hypothetical protein KIW84_041263 [Pisum sativum]
MSNNIDNGVNNFVSIDEGSIPMNNVIHDGSKPVNGDFTKDDDFCNASLLYEYIVIKWKYLALSRFLSKEDLSFEVDVQLLKEVIDNLERALMDCKTKVDAKVQDIVSALRRKVGEKIFHVDVTSTHMENLSFHSETSVQQWKYVLQRRLMKENEDKKENIPYGLLNSSLKLNVGKDVSVIVSNICASVNEIDLVFDG